MTVGSPSIGSPDYWWYRARAGLLRAALASYVGAPGRGLDVGSADGPSVDWLRARGRWVSLDLDPRGLQPGDVCGSATSLPFADESFDVVAAFDVIEHCEPEAQALAEVHRVLAPGGKLLMSVPAYQWAWTQFDDHNHHHRRYTRRRATQAVRAEGFEVLRASYMFTGTFPFFAADRLRTRISERWMAKAALSGDQVPELPDVPSAVETVLMSLTRTEKSVLRRWNLPFGSSVVLAARKPGLRRAGVSA